MYINQNSVLIAAVRFLIELKALFIVSRIDHWLPSFAFSVFCVSVADMCSRWVGWEKTPLTHPGQRRGSAKNVLTSLDPGETLTVAQESRAHLSLGFEVLSYLFHTWFTGSPWFFSLTVKPLDMYYLTCIDMLIGCRFYSYKKRHAPYFL